MALDIHDKIASSLGTDFLMRGSSDGQDGDDTPLELLIPVNMREVVQLSETADEDVIQDQEFIRTELIDVDNQIKYAMDILVQDLRQGTKDRTYEVYAKLGDTRIKAIEALKQFGMQVKDRQNFTVPSPTSVNVTNNTMIATSADLLKQLTEIAKGNRAEL